MTSQSTKRSGGWKVLVVFLLIIIGAIVGISQLSTTTTVENIKEDVVEKVTPIQESEEDKALAEIKSRPDVQKQFENLVKDIYLTEVREKKAAELEQAEAELEAHRAEVVSF